MAKGQQQQGPSRSPYLHAYDEWVKEYYGQLIGARVAGVGMDSHLCPIIIFEMVDGKRAHTTLTADDEGDSGPGYLQGLPPVKRRAT